MGTLEQITKLIDAGYTKEEIVALFAQETQTQPQAQPQTQPEPQPQAQPQTQPQPQQPQQPTGFEKLDEAIAKMDKLADGIAKIAIMNSNQPPQQSTNDFLAQIINPRLGKEN